MAMNLTTAVRFYVDKIVADPKISGQVIASLELMLTSHPRAWLKFDRTQLCICPVLSPPDARSRYPPLQNVRRCAFLIPITTLALDTNC